MHNGPGFQHSGVLFRQFLFINKNHVKMEVTLTITGQLSPEIAQMLHALGVALQSEQTENSSPAAAKEPEAEAEVVKKTRTRKSTKAAKEPEAEDEPEPEAEVEADKEPDMETVRELAVKILRDGKSTQVKKILEDHDLKKLSDAKPEQFKSIHEALLKIA